jgi:RNase H-fold protein (predicted Holliday junction resolvase)
MKHISIKKLEKISLQLAHAIVEVRSWSVILSYNLNKKKDYKLSDLYEEARKIEDFGKQLQDTIKLRIEVVNEHTSSQDK